MIGVTMIARIIPPVSKPMPVIEPVNNGSHPNQRCSGGST
jgi:hypothetical protein